MIYGERDRLFNLNDGAGLCEFPTVLAALRVLTSPRSFWDNIDRIYAEDYVPTEEDLLRVRIRTMGFDEAVFTYKDTAFRVLVRCRVPPLCNRRA